MLDNDETNPKELAWMVELEVMELIERLEACIVIVEVVIPVEIVVGWIL